MMPKKPLCSRTLTTRRTGCCTLPRDKSRNASAIAGMSSSIRRSLRTCSSSKNKSRLAGRCRDRLHTLRLQRLIDCRQFGGYQLLEVCVDVAKLATQRIMVGQLVITRLAFIAEDRVVKLVRVLAQPFFTGNRAALRRGDNLFSRRV